MTTLAQYKLENWIEAFNQVKLEAFESGADDHVWVYYGKVLFGFTYEQGGKWFLSENIKDYLGLIGDSRDQHFPSLPEVVNFIAQIQA